MPINEFEIVDYLEEARSRVTHQFKDKVVFDKYLQILISGQVEIQEAVRQVMQLRSIDTATGKQLDIIGEIVGQQRELIDADLIPYFAFLEYPEARTYGDLTDSSIGGYYSSVTEPITGNVLLNDEQYRQFIKAKIIKNITNVTPNQLLTFISFVFGVNVNNIIAEGSGEFTVLIGRNLNSFERALVTYYTEKDGYPSYFLPKPAGVRINTGSFDGENFFAFQGVPSAKGFGEYVEDVPPEESLSLNFTLNEYDVWEVSFTIVGGGKYAALFV